MRSAAGLSTAELKELKTSTNQAIEFLKFLVDAMNNVTEKGEAKVELIESDSHDLDAGGLSYLHYLKTKVEEMRRGNAKQQALINGFVEGARIDNTKTQVREKHCIPAELVPGKMREALKGFNKLFYTGKGGIAADIFTFRDSELRSRCERCYERADLKRKQVTSGGQQVVAPQEEKTPAPTEESGVGAEESTRSAKTEADGQAFIEKGERESKAREKKKAEEEADALLKTERRDATDAINAAYAALLGVLMNPSLSNQQISITLELSPITDSEDLNEISRLRLDAVALLSSMADFMSYYWGVYIHYKEDWLALTAKPTLLAKYRTYLECRSKPSKIITDKDRKLHDMIMEIGKMVKMVGIDANTAVQKETKAEVLPPKETAPVPAPPPPEETESVPPSDQTSFRQAELLGTLKSLRDIATRTAALPSYKDVTSEWPTSDEETELPPPPDQKSFLRAKLLETLRSLESAAALAPSYEEVISEWLRTLDYRTRNDDEVGLINTLATKMLKILQEQKKEASNPQDRRVYQDFFEFISGMSGSREYKGLFYALKLAAFTTVTNTAVTKALGGEAYFSPEQEFKRALEALKYELEKEEPQPAPEVPMFDETNYLIKDSAQGMYDAFKDLDLSKVDAASLPKITNLVHATTACVSEQSLTSSTAGKYTLAYEAAKTTPIDQIPLGKTKLGLRALGFGLVALGAVVLLGSLVGLVYSAGISAPISLAGIKIGIDLLQIGLSMGVLVGAGAMFGGMTLVEENTPPVVKRTSEIAGSATLYKKATTLFNSISQSSGDNPSGDDKKEGKTVHGDRRKRGGGGSDCK